jgi:hypothetical protein
MHIGEEELMAYCDGELDPIAAKRVERAASQAPDLQRQLEAHKSLRETIHRCFDPVMDEEIPDRLTRLLSAAPADNLLPFRTARRPAQPLWAKLVALAATFAVGIVAGQLTTGASGPLAVEEDRLVARGDLHHALEAQLASNQPQDAPSRIGISFASQSGAICRTFETSALAGIACRKTEDWNLILTTPSERGSGGDYRQAGAPHIVMEAAQELIAGEPFDASEERRMRDSGWSFSEPR